MITINLIVCECDCGDTIVSSVELDGQPVPDEQLCVNTTHGYPDDDGVVQPDDDDPESAKIRQADAEYHSHDTE